MWKTLEDWILFKAIAGQRTQVLVWLAFVFNIVCFFDLPEVNRNVYKLIVQQMLILCIGTIGAKLDRLRPPTS